jgi:hypothetical protein
MPSVRALKLPRAILALLLLAAVSSACVAAEAPGAATEVPAPAETPPADGPKRPFLSQIVCPPDAPPRRPRRPPPPGPDVQNEWLQRMCSLQLAPVVGSSDALDIGGGQTATMEFTEMAVHHFPGLVDSNSPAFWSESVLVAFNSTYWPERTEGPGLETLGPPIDIELQGQAGGGGYWIEAVWRDDATGTLYAWYHREPEDIECLTAPVIGAAISTDEGRTWQDQGPVLENPYPIDCDYANGYFTGGNGDFSVILDQEQRYFYFLYSNYAGPLEEQGVGVARSAFADKGQPGTVFKYDGDAWSQPGLAGLTAPIFPAASTWHGPEVDAFWGPSVHWNSYLQRYVALLNRTRGTLWAQEGVYVSFSTDLVQWTQPRKVLDSSAWYPQVIGLGAGETDTLAGQTARVYVGGISAYTLGFQKQ